MAEWGLGMADAGEAVVRAEAPRYIAVATMRRG